MAWDPACIWQRLLLVLLCSCSCQAWPSRFSDCRAFPSLGQPQWRRVPHPPVELQCTPIPPTSFEYCLSECSGAAVGGQNCSKTACKCEEACMADDLTCSKHPMVPYPSTAEVLNARGGQTKLLLNGAAPTSYQAGSTNRITIVPAPVEPIALLSTVGMATDLQRGDGSSTFFLLDAGVGTFRPVQKGSGQALSLQCNGTRIAFNSQGGQSIELDWIAPETGSEAVVLRVAAATSMGNITVNAAVLNSNAPQLPADQDAYACSTSELSTRQCVRVPNGTPGASSKDDCSKSCKTYRCNKCFHVYFPQEDGQGRQFEDLPDDWKCPMCGEPKSAYTKQVVDSSGSVQWAHTHIQV